LHALRHAIDALPPCARLPDCEALDAAQVFGFAMKHPVAWRIEASSTLS